jgi:transcriptional regulator with XRE-family HTH domain
MKKDRRDGTALKPTTQNPAAVRLARITAGLEQRELAGKIGVSPSYMSEIEGGTRSVSPANLRAIAEACGVDVEKIVNPKLAEAA